MYTAEKKNCALLRSNVFIKTVENEPPRSRINVGVFHYAYTAVILWCSHNQTIFLSEPTVSAYASVPCVATQFLRENDAKRRVVLHRMVIFFKSTAYTYRGTIIIGMHAKCRP